MNSEWSAKWARLVRAHGETLELFPLELCRTAWHWHQVLAQSYTLFLRLQKRLQAVSRENAEKEAPHEQGRPEIAT